MKIIISNYDDISNPYYGGGGAIAIHEVAKRLSKKHEVTIITGKYPGSKDRKVDSINYKRIGSKNYGPKLGQFIYQLSLPYYVRFMKYDIWIESFTPPFSTAFLPLFTKKPVIGLTHLLAGKAKSKEYKLPFYLIENIGIKNYKNFIVLTEDLKKQILTLNKSAKIEVIPNGVNTYDLKSQKRKEKHILFLGRIEMYQKGLNILLNSYEKVQNKIQYELVIAGFGPDEKKLKELIFEKRLNKRVKFIGKIQGKKKLDILNESVFLVMPSRYENYPLVLIESLTLGRPVLTFDIEGIKWLPENCCVKVKSFDEEKFGEQMIKLSTDSKLKKEIIKNGKLLVRDFDWDNIAQKYFQIIEKVLMKGGTNENTHHSRILPA